MSPQDKALEPKAKTSSDRRVTYQQQDSARTFGGPNGPLAILVAVCVVIEVALQLADFGLLGRSRLRALTYESGAFWPGLLRDWRPNYPSQPALMFLTYGFLHAGLMHLVFNMITLWSLGRAVIERIGRANFLGVYFVSMVIGGLVYGLVTTGGQPMVGASGALFGIAGALVALVWLSRRNTVSSLRATWKALAFLFGINIVMYVLFAGRLAWETHLGGFVAGWVYCVVLNRVGRP